VWTGRAIGEVCVCVVESDRYNSEVVFHGGGYTAYDPRLCRSDHVVAADFDLASRRSTRHQLTASASGRHVTGNTTSSASRRLCDVSGCEWGDALTVDGGGDRFIYATQPTQRRVIVIDVKDSLSPVEVGH